MTDQDQYLADDERHPIPKVDVCDVHGVRKGGGADMILIICTPMKSDVRSRERLMKKIELYLGFITSETFKAECGTATTDNTTITVHIHPDSDSGIFSLLDQCRGWVEDNGARLKIKKENSFKFEVRHQ